MDDVLIDYIEAFLDYMEAMDRSAITVKGYRSDLRSFATWFEQTNGEEFSLELVTPLDVREYKQHLLNVKRQKPNTVNRKLASLSSLMNWGVETGQIGDDPTRNIKLVQEQERGPRWLDWKEQCVK